MSTDLITSPADCAASEHDVESAMGTQCIPPPAPCTELAGDAPCQRDEWLALIAHDLRAPLNVVVLAAELLRDGSLAQERRDHWLEVIRSAAERMNTLVTDLLETARLEASSSALDLRARRLRPLLLETLYAYQAVAERAGVGITVGECSEELVGLVDGTAILRVLSNLVDNAIRFTPAGGLVSIEARPTSEGIRLTVSDTGCGISPEHLPHVFDRFWQAAHSGRGGAGLGLAIVRRIVEQHGGSVSVDSEPGCGTLFQIVLPDPSTVDRDEGDRAAGDVTPH
ncbi:MAG TPA: HAMP domain-containing sensor histidine kinase [Longimicrobiales bacterium]